MVTIEPIKNDKKKDAHDSEATAAGVEQAKTEEKKPEAPKEKTDSDRALEAAERAAHVEDLIKSQKYRLPIKK